MFASKALLEWHTNQETSVKSMSDRLQVEEDADYLLALCRLAYKFNSDNADTVVYLRPYYESIFLAKAGCGAKHAKELLEVAWEATQGKPYMKTNEEKPVLAILTIAGRQYYVFDNPKSGCALYTSEERFRAEDFRQATSGDATKLTLPDKLRQAMRDCTESKALIQWRDPAMSLGYRSPHLTTEAMMKSPKDSRAKIEFDNSAKMPFQIPIAFEDATQPREKPKEVALAQ